MGLRIITVNYSNVHEEGWDGKETQKPLIDQKYARINTHTQIHAVLVHLGFYLI